MFRGVHQGQEEVHEERRGLHQEERREEALRLNPREHRTMAK